MASARMASRLRSGWRRRHSEGRESPGTGRKTSSRARPASETSISGPLSTDPVPRGAPAPEVDERPEAAERGGQVLQPDRARDSSLAHGVGEAGNEVVFDGGGAHQAEVAAPGARIDQEGAALLRARAAAAPASSL